MENNIENKHKFFSLYFGQDVYMFDETHPCVNKMTYWNIIENDNDSEDYLLLKSLLDISNEDALEGIKICRVYRRKDGAFITEFSPIEKIKKSYQDIPVWRLDVADYLRSKGYALPFMGLSVEEQVSRGWVKLVGIPEGLYIDKNTLK